MTDHRLLQPILTDDSSTCIASETITDLSPDWRMVVNVYPDGYTERFLLGPINLYVELRGSELLIDTGNPVCPDICIPIHHLRTLDR